MRFNAFFFAVKTDCIDPNITLITYNERMDNFFCRRKCGKLSGGRVAVPQNRQQYDCITTAIVKGLAKRETPFWTGIRVRPEGGLYDPLTNQTVEVFEKRDSDRKLYGNLSPDHTLLIGHSTNRSENCIYLHRGFFVETKCTFLHNGLLPIQCACIQGKQLPATGIDCGLLCCSLGYSSKYILC